MAITISPELAAQFKRELTAVQKTAKAIMALDKSKMDDSGDKFLHIRAVRIDHTAREVSASKSLRS